MTATGSELDLLVAWVAAHAILFALVIARRVFAKVTGA